MNSIPILDLKPEIDELWDELQVAIGQVLRSGHFIMGPHVTAFEQEAAAYLGVKHAIAVNSGTDALVIGLRAAGIGDGDEVITTSFTFFATAEAISLVGATPVFVDIDPQTLNLDHHAIEQVITPRTKAVIPVHLFGQSVHMKPLLDLCSYHNLIVIEDVAQAFGGEYRGKKLGSFGEIGCYSFFPTKNLGAYGDGGLITTASDTMAETARMLRVHGSRKRYHNELIGYNSRLDELQAAILRLKLPCLDQWNRMRHAVALHYNELLRDVKGIVLPFEASYGKHVYHQYTIRVQEGKRDLVHEMLAEQNITSMICYPVPVYQFPMYKHMELHLQHTEEAAKEVLSLPIWPQIEYEKQVRVTETIKQALE